MDEWGHYKSKGAYVKGLGTLDYDLPIVNTALVDYMTKGVPIEKTISECNDLKEFHLFYSQQVFLLMKQGTQSRW